MKVFFYIPCPPKENKIKSFPFGAYPPLGVGYLASVLLREGHSVEICDNAMAGLSQREVGQRLSLYRPEVVGISTYTYSFEDCLLFAEQVKKIDENIKVILGGPHASALPKEILSSHHCVDLVVMGEGEMTFVEVIRNIKKGLLCKGIDGVACRDVDQTVWVGRPRGWIEDLDTIPFPAYELLDMEQYYPASQRRLSNRRFATVTTSRGCPFGCAFCSRAIFGKKVRFRSPVNVVDEIEHLIIKHGVGEILFVDDVFTLKEERVFQISEEIVRRKLDLLWTCSSRVENASDALYAAMAKAGCRGICFGVESASPEVRRLMKKDFSSAQVEKAVMLAKRYFPKVFCTFVLGMPGDTAENIKSTIQWAKRLEPDYARFYIATPYPGSDIFKIAVEKKLIDPLRVKWSHDLGTIHGRGPICLSEVSADELLFFFRKAHLSFYLRPKYILMRFLRGFGVLKFLEYFDRACRLLFYKLGAIGKKS